MKEVLPKKSSSAPSSAIGGSGAITVKLASTAAIVSWRPQHTQFLGRAFANCLRGGAKVLLLNGPLGAGKTCFVQGLAVGLGVKEGIKSPTYTLMMEYELPQGGKLYHLDCYRSDTADVLLAETVAEFLGEEKNLLVVEWAEQLPAGLPLAGWQIDFQYRDEESRRLCYTQLR